MKLMFNIAFETISFGSNIHYSVFWEWSSGSQLINFHIVVKLRYISIYICVHNVNLVFIQLPTASSARTQIVKAPGTRILGWMFQRLFADEWRQCSERRDVYNKCFECHQKREKVDDKNVNNLARHNFYKQWNQLHNKQASNMTKVPHHAESVSKPRRIYAEKSNSSRIQIEHMPKPCLLYHIGRLTMR